MMNIYRLAGDYVHLLAIAFILSRVIFCSSCKGLSGKSQILYLTVFVSRYVDLFTNFISVYNTTLKVVFIGAKAIMVYLMFINSKIKKTYTRETDTFRIEILILPCIALACAFNHEFSVMEVLWTFSIYLEAVVMVPQMYMMMKAQEIDRHVLVYLTALCSYRALYICNWIYRYNHEGFYDLVAIAGGCTQTCIYWIAGLAALFMLYCPAIKRRENGGSSPFIISDNQTDTENATQNNTNHGNPSSLTSMIQKLDLTLKPGTGAKITEFESDKQKILDV